MVTHSLANEKIPSSPIPVGVAACLLGRKVRFNAGDKRDEFVTEVLGHFFEWVPVVLIRHFIEQYEISYLMDQVYLKPHPKELALRNFSAPR